MSSVQKSADDLRNLANRFRSVMEVAEVLERIGSLEQTEREAQVRKESAYAQAEEAKKSLAEVSQQLEKANFELKTIEKRGLEAQESAQAKASEIVNKANRDAATIITDAKHSESEVLAAASDKLEEIKIMDRNIADKKDELAAIIKQIVDMKAKIQALVKG